MTTQHRSDRELLQASIGEFIKLNDELFWTYDSNTFLRGKWDGIIGSRLALLIDVSSERRPYDARTKQYSLYDSFLVTLLLDGSIRRILVSGVFLSIWDGSSFKPFTP